MASERDRDLYNERDLYGPNRLGNNPYRDWERRYEDQHPDGRSRNTPHWNRREEDRYNKPSHMSYHEQEGKRNYMRDDRNRPSEYSEHEGERFSYNHHQHQDRNFHENNYGERGNPYRYGKGRNSEESREYRRRSDENIYNRNDRSNYDAQRSGSRGSNNNPRYSEDIYGHNYPQDNRYGRHGRNYDMNNRYSGDYDNYGATHGVTRSYERDHGDTTGKSYGGTYGSEYGHRRYNEHFRGVDDRHQWSSRNDWELY